MRAFRIQENDEKHGIIPDIWKRLPEGEEFDHRVNYGFTSKRSYEESMKGHEFNFKNCPVSEQKGLADGDDEPFEAVRRRIVCGRMGKAAYVAEDCDVNHAEGRYKNRQRNAGNFLQRPDHARTDVQKLCTALPSRVHDRAEFVVSSKSTEIQPEARR